jgi:hypothetical protein
MNSSTALESIGEKIFQMLRHYLMIKSCTSRGVEVPLR